MTIRTWISVRVVILTETHGCKRAIRYEPMSPLRSTSSTHEAQDEEEGKYGERTTHPDILRQRE